jgi:High potential iron-sulfur protein
MSSSGNNCQRVSRRVMLAEIALGAAVATAATRALAQQVLAQQKVSQADAKYQGQPKGQQHCDNCINFQSPNACKLVEGDVSTNGWCQLYSPKT